MLDIMLILSPSQKLIITLWPPKSNSRSKHVAQAIFMLNALNVFSKVEDESCRF